MSYAPATEWEIRADGDPENGGGFYDRDPGTSVDYSQQAAAQLSLSDIATDGAGTGISSVTGGFTAAMVGNIMFIEGGDTTANWYEITAYTDTNAVTIDRSCGANKTSVTGNVGGAWGFGESGREDLFFEAKIAGNVIWIKAGTHTFSETIASSKNGSIALPIEIKGYNATRGDAPEGDDRPYMVTGAYYGFCSNNYHWRTMHLRMAGSGTLVFRTYNNSRALNIKAISTNAVATSQASFDRTTAISIGCEYSCSGGDGAEAYGTFIDCWSHDNGNDGFYCGVTNMRIVGCLITNCTRNGIYIGARYTSQIQGCTIYGCGTGIYGTTAYEMIIINNIIAGNTLGVHWNSDIQNNVWEYNIWDNDTDVSNVTKGDTDITADPLLVDPEHGDFSLGAGSPAFNAAIGLRMAGIT
ncbi:MAG: NosD domain-containing protein [Candidatus Thorarchaeota archaeon]